LLFEGVSTGNRDKIVAGALAVSILAIGANGLLRLLERRAALAIRGEDA
jgi:osmoprotectant transport system permease protein